MLVFSHQLLIQAIVYTLMGYVLLVQVFNMLARFILVLARHYGVMVIQALMVTRAVHQNN
jgi:hypothetical protein